MPSHHSIFLSPKASAPMASSSAKKNTSQRASALKAPGAMHPPVQLTATEATHVRSMIKPGTTLKGKRKPSDSPAPGVPGIRMPVDEGRQGAQADKASRNPFEEMGNEYHESVDQPSFLVGTSSESDEEEGVRQPGEVIERSSPGAPSTVTTKAITNQDIIDTLLDDEIHEVRLFLMTKQKGDVMRRILKPVAKGRVNKWQVDSFRALIAYSKSVRDFEAVGGVVQLDFFNQNNPLIAAGEASLSDPVDSRSEARLGADGDAPRQAKAIGIQWARVFIVSIIAVATGGALTLYLTYDDDTALDNIFWFLRQIIALDRRISVLVESAKRIDFHLVVKTRYMASQSFIRYVYSWIVGRAFALIRATLEFVLSRLEDLRDYAVNAQDAPQYY